METKFSEGLRINPHPSAIVQNYAITPSGTLSETLRATLQTCSIITAENGVIEGCDTFSKERDVGSLKNLIDELQNQQLLGLGMCLLNRRLHFHR